MASSLKLSAVDDQAVRLGRFGRDVCLWHFADMLFMLSNVRFWGQSRRRPTAASQSRFMSTRPSRRETVHVDCQSGTRPGGSSATVRAPRERVVKTLATHA